MTSCRGSLTATNPSGTVTIAYDNRNRVSSVTDVFGQVVSYAYDANNNRTQLSLDGGTSATYQYYLLNRLTQLTDSGSLNTTFAYDPTNKLTSRSLPNGVVTTSQYDGLDRLTRLTHAKGANTLADFQYQFNAVNNITQMVDATGGNNYTYDSLDRLTAATHPNQANESYSYDDVGNRTASHQGSSYTYQPFNRLMTINSNTYAYDANGNLVSKTDASGSWSYTWDYENRQKQATRSGGVTVTYGYDALGRRVQRASTTGGTEKFVYDGADVLRDLDGNGNTVADYLNGPGIDNKLRQTAGTTAAYFATDHLGTTRALTDEGGSVSTTLDYDSFGNVIGGSASTRYTYTGREADSDTGLMYYRARWYDSHVGRFLLEDPIGLKGGLNLFTYVHNAPIKKIDPMGLDDADKPWYPEEDGKPLFPNTSPRPFEDGGVLSAGTLVEFITGNERARQPCKKFGERFWDSFIETNQAIPGIAAPIGTTLITGPGAAQITGEPGLLGWAWRGGGPGLGGSIVQSGATSLATHAAFEAGVANGSYISAIGCPCGY